MLHLTLFNEKRKELKMKKLMKNLKDFLYHVCVELMEKYNFGRASMPV
jgi:hypothetical protein